MVTLTTVLMVSTLLEPTKVVVTKVTVSATSVYDDSGTNKLTGIITKDGQDIQSTIFCRW